MHALLIVAFVLPWVLVAVLVFIVYVLMRQHGDFLHGQQQLLVASAAGPAPMPTPDTRAGLDVGVEAPDLVLRDVQGAERSLAEFRGEPHVLAFFSTHCGYCKEMAPQLTELPEGAPRFVLISSGDPAEVRALASKHDWKFDVLVEDADWRAFKAYEPVGTPSAYLVDAEGRIARELAIGSAGVMQLLEPPSPAHAGSNGHSAGAEQSPREKEEAAVERAQRAGLRVSGTEESSIKRGGLEAGTVAPNVVLPDLEGAMHSLADYRGRRVLLVFSDVNCGPCDALAPDLVELDRKDDDVQVVMISRGDPDANRQKAADHGYPFPVLLQKSWEVSKQYAMFATPIAYLIDENGVIAADVAVGSDAILGLVAS